MRMLMLAAFLGWPLAVISQPTYTIVFLNKRSDAPELEKALLEKLMEGHMANINRLANEGKLLAAGPFDGGGGLFILKTTSMEEAKAWVSTDPAVQANRWRLEYLPYTPRIGSICPPDQPFEMVSYTFIRFNAIVEKFTASNYPSLILQHEHFVTENIDNSDIVTEAIFGPNEGGVLILKRDTPAEMFAEDPAVQQGLIDVQVRKLYIAKHSFCE